MADQLSVPLKKALDLSLEECLSPFLASYLKNSSSDLEKAVKDLDKLRRDVISKTPQKTLFMLEQLYRYHDQIRLLEDKFPSETALPFVWIDSFNKVSVFSGKPTLGLPYLGYEKHCVLFNIGALQTQLAVESTIIDTDEERKNATKYYQSAAGIFDKLKPAESAGDNLTPDFHPDLLSALVGICIAQAQEMFVTKAIKDKMKDAIVAKLCIQTEEMFSDILLKMTRDSVKSGWDKNWLSNAKGKKYAYFGLANLYQSKVCGEKKMIGEQIGRLNLAIENLKKGQDKIGNPNLFSFFLAEAKRFLVEAEKDNNFIYHEVVPPASNLPTIQKVASARLAKMTPVPDLFTPDFNNPFEVLKTLEILEPTPSAPPRLKKKADEVEATQQEDTKKEDSHPKIAADEKPEYPKLPENTSPQSGREEVKEDPIKAPAAPNKKPISWNSVLNDSWSLLKSEVSQAVTQAAENYVYGKRNP